MTSPSWSNERRPARRWSWHGDLTGRADPDRRAPSRARRHVRRAQPRPVEPERLVPGPGVAAVAHRGWADRACDGRQPVAAPGRPDQCGLTSNATGPSGYNASAQVKDQAEWLLEPARPGAGERISV